VACSGKITGLIAGQGFDRIESPAKHKESTMMKKLFFCSIFILQLSSIAFAQEFEIKNYDINARVVPEEQKVDLQAKLHLVNLSDPDLGERILLSPDSKPRLSFFLTPKAKVEAMKVNGAAVQIKTAEDARNNLMRVYIEMTSALIGLPELDVEFTYSIPSTDRGAAIHVSSGETFLLPASFWVPVTHTPYADHGADTAPFSLKVEAPTNSAGPASLKVISSGIRKSETSFEQSLAAQPFFIIGDYDVVSRNEAGHQVEVYYPRGSGEIGKQQAERIAVEAERAVMFYAKYFNVGAIEPFRIISTQARQLNTATSDSFSASRETSASMVGAVTIDENVFRRDVVDLGMIELISGAATRAWIDGQVLLRGRGAGMLRDALPVYLVAQYLGARFGPPQRDAAFERFRRAYSTIARNDAPLLTQSQLDRNYATSVYNKGALIWRMIEKMFGVQTLETALRSSLSRGRVDALSLAGWFAPQQNQQKRGPAQPHPLCQFSRCANFKENLISAGADRKLVNDLFTTWIETVSLPDFAIGQPQNTANGVESTIANFGSFDDTLSKSQSGDLTVEVVAINDKGEKISRTVTAKAGEYGSVSFPAGVNIKTIEVDPDKIYLQSDYTNDVVPRRPSQSEAFGQANLAFSKNDFATAEAKAREGLVTTSNAPTLQALLGRALLAQKKADEAGKIFNDALKAEPLPIQAYGMAHLGLAELAIQQEKFDIAAKHFRFAAAADLDAATTIAARDGALKAERGANAVKIPDDVRSFLQKFDAAVLQGGSAAVNQFVDLGNLRKFAQNLVVRKPSTWLTEALRAEEWDANRVAVDVTLKIRIESKDYSGRAVYVISRAGGKLLLSEVPTFDVK
jgi:tetratricopeptide (TPR) repeat protein